MTKNTEVSVKQQNHSDSLMGRTDEAERHVVPAADIYETSDSYVVMLDMPGSMKENITVVVDRSNLVITGKVHPLHKEQGTLLQNEISALNYHRGFNLGEGIDPSNVDARYEDGVLTIKLYKKEEVKLREIRIQ